MRYIIITAMLTGLMLTCGSREARFTTAATVPDGEDFKERDEVNRSYQLPIGARVEVSSIRGSVEIGTSDTETAEVRIIRTARTRAELEHHQIVVEQTSGGLSVKGRQEHDGGGRKAQVNQRVILKLPRRISLTVSSISGPVKVGDVDGP
ncbi:MAG: hypothetical protein WCD76_13510, partial [Pyrinomonadaceae bacterium]